MIEITALQLIQNINRLSGQNWENKCKIFHTIAEELKWDKFSDHELSKMLDSNQDNNHHVTSKKHAEKVAAAVTKAQIREINATPSHVDHKLENEGTRNYGGWEILEIMVKYGDRPGTFMALKHILRKPKVTPGVAMPHAVADDVRIVDIKKAITYLQREVDMAEGRYKPAIV